MARTTQELVNLMAGTTGLTEQEATERIYGRVTPLVVTAATTLTTASGEYVLADSAGGAYAVTLPSAVTVPGLRFTIVKTDAAANTVTVGTTSSQTINGSTTYTGLTAQYKVVQLVSNGANWLIVGTF